MQDLKVTLIQSDIFWHQPSANLAMFEEKIWSLGESTDVILLPEMFSTGFTMDVQNNAEPPNSKTYRWMTQMAAQTNALLIGSYIVKDGKDYYNRLHAVTPDGKHYAYDKRHLFRMAEEHNYYLSGGSRVIIKWKGWKIMPLICYDLRFPVWSRNRVVENTPEYDLLLFVANWPEPRITAWDHLLKARAIENLSYCIGLNRVGEDGNKVNYCGHSAIYDPKGTTLLDLGNEEKIASFSLSKKSLHKYREKFPAFNDADDFTIQ